MTGLLDLPDELRERKQWHLWSNKNGTKIPKQVNGRYARSNAPSTWCTFDEAMAVIDQYDGIAFVITADDPYCGIDLDDCLDNKGKLREWALPFVARLDTKAVAEVSPSGTGIKLLTIAKKPHGSSCQVSMGPGKQQMECYDHGRFWCMTGQFWNRNNQLGNGQPAVDFTCGEFLSPRAPVKVESAPVVSPCTTTLEIRAQAYCNSIPPATEGSRNVTAFKLAGSLAALDDHGTRLTLVQVIALVLEWNSRLPDPLPEDEVEKAARSAMTNGTPRPVKTATAQPKAVSRVDLSELNKPKKQSPHDPALPRHLIENAPGLIGDLYRWFDETALYQLPEVFLASAIAAMSVLTGRKVRDWRGSRTNVYVLSMAPTASGKEHPRHQIKKLFEAADAQELLGAENLASASGLATNLVEHPARLMQIDEFGYLLEGMCSNRAQQYLKSIEGDLLQLYTSAGTMWSGRAYAESEKTPKIDQPHLVICGSCTAETVWSEITSKQIHAGLLGRIQIFEAPGYVQLRDEIADYQDEVPENLVRKVRWWHQYQPETGNLATDHPRPTVMTAADGVRERLETHMRQISAKRLDDESKQAAVWSRSAEKASKLAMLAACSEGRFEISMEDADWAIALQNALTRKMLLRIHEHVADSSHEHLKKRVVRVITAYGKPLSSSLLTRKTQFIRNRQERASLLDELVEAEIIASWNEGDGRDKTRFYSAPPLN